MKNSKQPSLGTTMRCSSQNEKLEASEWKCKNRSAREKHFIMQGKNFTPRVDAALDLHKASEPTFVWKTNRKTRRKQSCKCIAPHKASKKALRVIIIFHSRGCCCSCRNKKQMNEHEASSVAAVARRQLSELKPQVLKKILWDLSECSRRFMALKRHVRKKFFIFILPGNYGRRAFATEI